MDLFTISVLNMPTTATYEELTAPSQAEKGRPLSRAKANVCRDADAMQLIVIMKNKRRMTTTRILAPVTFFVASENTWINGRPVGESRASCTLGIINRYVRTEPMANGILRKNDRIMD